MRVAILTSLERGFPSLCFEALRARGVEVAVVIGAEGTASSRAGRLRKIARKVRRIGLLGALNGMRMRRWYAEDVERLAPSEPLRRLCTRAGVPLRMTRSVNDPATVAALRESGAVLGLSLGNPWIAPAVYTALPEGMLNVHHELLPEYQGAQSVIWSLRDGRRTTGYTIHRIERGIDTGAMVSRVEVPIEFRESLADTVTATYAALLVHSAETLAAVVATWGEHVETPQPRGDARRFTTPTWREFRAIVTAWRRMRASP